MELLIDKLRKIEALARSGIGGEKETAQRMLDALCKKHGITLDQIAEPVTEDCLFAVKDKWENSLLETIILHICQTTKVRNWWRGRKRGFELTRIQRIDVEDCYKHYRKIYTVERKRLMQDMTSAFVHKYHLFGPPRDKEGADDKSVDLEQIARLVALIRGMKSEAWEGRKRIEA
jgi:hypothetical protein